MPLQLQYLFPNIIWFLLQWSSQHMTLTYYLFNNKLPIAILCDLWPYEHPAQHIWVSKRKIYNINYVSVWHNLVFFQRIPSQFYIILI